MARYGTLIEKVCSFGSNMMARWHNAHIMKSHFSEKFFLAYIGNFVPFGHWHSGTLAKPRFGTVAQLFARWWHSGTAPVPFLVGTMAR